MKGRGVEGEGSCAAVAGQRGEGQEKRCVRTRAGNRCTMRKRAGDKMGKDVRPWENDSLCFPEQRREG